MSTIKQKTINGMAWTVTERFSLQVVHMLITIVLARLLEPSEHGLFGMLAIFISIAQSLLDSGFGSALIQKKDVTQTDSTSVFYFNLIIGVLLAGILSLLAPLIAKFYEQPLLVPLTRVLSINMVINAFSLVQLSLLRKNMDFKKLFTVSFIAVIISGICGIFAAYKGMSVWSLVIQALSNSLVQAGLLWIINKWRPTGHFSSASLKSMFAFGSKLMIAGLIETIYKNIYKTFIGKTYSAADLGYYDKAFTIEQAGTVATSQSLGAVFFPAFSPLQDDNRMLKHVYRKTIRLSMFLHIPLMITLIAVAEPLFLFLLTEKWAKSIPLFRLLCVVGIFYPFQVQNYNLFRIKGRSGLLLKVEIFKYVLTTLAIVMTYKSGISYLIFGQIVVAVISNFLYSHITGKWIGYPLIELFKDLFPFVPVSSIMGAAVYFVGKVNVDSHFLLLIIQVSTAILVYYIINRIFKSPELTEFIAIVTNFSNRFFLIIKGLLCKNH